MLDVASDSPADVLASAQGLLLTGGGDVHPSLYGEAVHSTFSAAEPGRDEFELELVRRALDADLPIFAICRGLQILTIAGGGTLVQDIPSELPGTTHHDVRDSRMTIAHEVWMASETLLERLMRTRIETGDVFDVNSRHHQAPKTVGAGVVVSATAPDGVIEAIEDPRPPLLPRRAVAPGELLPHRRVQGAVRRLHPGRREGLSRTRTPISGGVMWRAICPAGTSRGVTMPPSSRPSGPTL